MSKKLIEAIVKELSSSNYEKLELLNHSVAKLVSIAKKADDAYYNHDEPIMSDREYDELEEMIKRGTLQINIFQNWCRGFFIFCIC